ncbi:MAG: SdrD B-like domain-containing protein [Oscillochloridaceae bacterium umkhey_bin13]
MHPRSRPHRRPVAPLLTLLLVLSLLPVGGPWGTPRTAAAAPSPAPAPLPVAPQVTTGPSFASAVPCLNAAPQVAITRHAENILEPDAGNPLAAVQTFTVGGAPTSLGTMRQVGATYSLAHFGGDGTLPERFFAAAYTRRMVGFGPNGVAGLYIFTRNAGGGWDHTAISVPGVPAVNRGGSDDGRLDVNTIASVGRSALGGMVVSPDGRELFVVNIAANRIERFTITAAGLSHAGNIPINYGVIPNAAAIQADLVPFALAWAPSPNPTNGSPQLVLGVTDTAYRAIRTPWGAEWNPSHAPLYRPDGSYVTPPQAHVLLYNVVNGQWWSQQVATVNLGDAAHRNRLGGSLFAQELGQANPGLNINGWNPWRNDLSQIPRVGREMRHPQPLLTTIEFMRQTAPSATNPMPADVMVLGLRDRTGDLAFNSTTLAIPANEFTAVSQGDLVALRWNGTTWAFAGHDFYQDNGLPNDEPGSTKHLENMLGSLSRVPGSGTSLDSAGDTLLGMGLAGNTTSGLYRWTGNAAAGGTPGYANNLIAMAEHMAVKAANLGDVEVLCSYALVGGRIWDDTNDNGRLDAGDPGIAGVRVEAISGNFDSPTVLATATTDAQGRYLFAVPPHRPFALRIEQTSLDTLYAQGFRQFADPNAVAGLLRPPMDYGDSDATKPQGLIEFAANGTGSSGGITGIAHALPWNGSDHRSFDFGLSKTAPAGQIGNQVWIDANGNGLQDAGEAGANGPALRDASNNPLRVTLRPAPGSAMLYPPTTTNVQADGSYLFRDVPPGDYTLTFTVPSGYTVSPQAQGSNRSVDSDPSSTAPHITPVFRLADNQTDTSRDMGLIPPGTDVGVTKSGPASAPVGSEFTYSLNYRNAGPSPAINVVVSDVLPTHLSFVRWTSQPSGCSYSSVNRTVTCSVASLPVSAANTTASFVVVSNATTPASVTSVANSVTLTATNDNTPGNNSSTWTTNLTRPDVQITKTGPATALVGDEFSYTLSYRNTGPTAATNVVVSDVLPTHLSFVRWTSQPAGCSHSSGTITCSHASMPFSLLNTDASFVVTASPTSPASVTSVANTATITATYDITPGNNSSTWTTGITRPDVSISKTGPATAPVGEEFTYTLRFRNLGTGVAANTVVSDPLPVGLNFVRWSAQPAGCSYVSASRTVSCNAGSLAAASPELTASFVVTASATAPASVDNTATITATHDITTTNNTSSFTTTLTRPDLSMTKTGPAEAAVGSEFTYTLTLRNQGSGAAQNTVVSDPLPTGLTFVRWASQPAGCSYSSGSRTVTCTLGAYAAGGTTTASLVVVPQEAAANLVTNVVTATTTSLGDLTPANNSASATTRIMRPNVWVGVRAVNKTLPGGPADNPAGALSYVRFRISYGNDTLGSNDAGTRLPVAKQRPSEFTWPAATTAVTVTLPADASLIGSNPVTNASGNPVAYTNATVGGRPAIVVNLNTLAARTSSAFFVTVQTAAAPGTMVGMDAQIGTSGRGDEPEDNTARDETPLVPLPVDLSGAGTLRLAIHSTLDPNSGGASATDGVYLSEGTEITWPAGEVLDFTPRLTELRVSDPSTPSGDLLPYAVEARITGWSFMATTVNGTRRTAQAADAGNFTGCRSGSAILPGTLLEGCTYAYPGVTPGQWVDPAVALLTAPLTEATMATQGHIYWTPRGIAGTPLPQLPAHVYRYTLDPLAPVTLEVAVEAEVRLLNRYPCAPQGEWNPLVCPPIPIPGTEQRLVYPGTFVVNLLVPRSVVGPGGRPGGVPSP